MKAHSAKLESGHIASLNRKNFHILVVDDDELVLKMICHFLRDRSYNVKCTTSGMRALYKVKESHFDLLLLDLRLPDLDGIDVLREVKSIDKSIFIMMMTGYGTIETAVEAMKLGADDFLIKPFKSFDVLTMAIKKIEEHLDLKNECTYLREQLNISYGMENIIGQSNGMTELFHLLRKVAPLDCSVLIEGESGTGKELIARALHKNSPRVHNRFVAINCGAIPEALLESEFFGYEKGAFTGAVRIKQGYFEVANTGTIFLDEISEMNEALQVKLLRIIQERKFQRVGGIDEISTDVRIISSTNKNLEEELSSGRFRKDLFYRINVFKISVPPLRERVEDIPLLSHYFLRKFSDEFEKKVNSISHKVLSTFLQHSWEGNVRELENVMQHAVAMADGEEITVSDLPDYTFVNTPGRKDINTMKPFDEAKKQFEKNYFENALEMVKGNVTRASRLTSIPRQYFYQKIKKYNLQPSRFREKS